MSATILITGAGTGFGRDAAERLARRGHRVYATMREIDGRNVGHRRKLERLADEENLRLRVLEFDVASTELVGREPTPNKLLGADLRRPSPIPGGRRSHHAG